MTEKRFSLICDNNVEWLMQSKLFLPIRDKNINQKITLKQCIDLLNELNDENVELKKELQKIYTIATINKVRYIVENIYDDLLYETSDESDYARTKVLKCLEDIDNLRDDLE